MNVAGMCRRWPWLILSLALGWFAVGVTRAAGDPNKLTADHLASPQAWATLAVITALAAAWVWIANGKASAVTLFATSMALFVGRFIDFELSGQPSAAALNGVAAALALTLWVVTIRRIGDGSAL